MSSDALVFGVACPSCGRPPGQTCVTPAGRGTAPHVSRVRLARSEDKGPQEGDVLYLQDHKYRVVASTAGLVHYRARSATAYCIPQDALAYDLVAGMWRAKA